MRIVIPFLLLILLILLLPQDRTASNDFDFMAAITQKLQAENTEEPDVPFLDKFQMYPPEHWEMFSGTAFWGNLNVSNPKVMHTNDTPLDAETLAGLSAWSFRFQFSEAWMPSATDPFCGYNCAEYILPKAGYETEIYYNSSFHFVEKTQDKKFISHSDFSSKLTQGFKDKLITFTGIIFPHPSYGVMGDMQKAGKASNMPRDKKFPFPWVLIQVKGWHETDISDLYKQSLIMAGQLYNTERIGHYASGTNAINEWIKALKKIDYSSQADPDMMAKACFTNSWTYHCLIEARELAKTYLTENIDKFDVDKQLIIDLAGIYGKEIEILKTGEIDLLPLPKCREFDQWNLHMREAQINTLTNFLVQEEEASLILNKISR